MSAPPPAPNGITNSIGFSGYCARAGRADRAVAAPTANPDAIAKTVFISSSRLRPCLLLTGAPAEGSAYTLGAATSRKVRTISFHSSGWRRYE